MIVERPLTDGSIALLNLGAQIDALEPEVRLGHATVETRAGLVEPIMLRGLIVGHIADYERAEEIAGRLVRDASTDAKALLARARTRACFHRFDDALSDIDHAEQLSLDAETANGERAAIFQALGRYDEAVALREEAAAHRASFENVAALVGLHAERGEIEAAERRYAQTFSRYRGVSPFPLALLAFQMGLMWTNEGELEDARSSFEAAQCRVPAYAPARGHLAEVEAELGEVDTAVARLHALALSSDDPDYAAQLARILAEAGRDREAGHWSRLAAARFDELMANRPEAFADHAAEFWLAAGADPDKAIRLAKMNVKVRNTPRARALLAQAVAASGPGRRIVAPH
jgi:tetratricopeptide (TPR) repeat protein